MGKYTAPLLMLAAFGLAACRGENGATHADSATPATGATTSATRADSAPRTAAESGVVGVPMVVPPRTAGVIARGSTINLRPQSTVCTTSGKLESIVTSTVAANVPGSNGVSIPAGAVVAMKLTALRPSRGGRDPITIGFEIQTVEFGGHTYALSALITREPIDTVHADATPGAGASKFIQGCLQKGSDVTAQLMAPLDVTQPTN